MTKHMTRKQLDSRVVDEIDKNLRQAFDDMAQQPVPDRFTDLLAQLRASEDKAKRGGDENV